MGLPAECRPLLAAARAAPASRARRALLAAMADAFAGGAGPDLFALRAGGAAEEFACRLAPLLPSDPDAAFAVFDALGADRHRRGDFATPVEVARRLCAAGAWRVAGPPGDVRAVDPACGSGAFLAGLLGVLGPGALAAGRVRGVERDTLAAEAARLRLFLAAREAGASPDPGLARAAVDTGDALLGPPPAGAPFDLVATNPPYVPAYSRQSEAARLSDGPRLRARYGGFGGRLNLFTCFLLAARDLVGPGGAAVFLLPDAFATGGSYAPVREALRTRFPRQDYVFFRGALFGATVRNLALFAGPGPERLRAVTLGSAADLPDVGSRLDSAPAAEWGPSCTPLAFASDFERGLWRRLCAAGGPALRDLFTVRDGVNPGPRSARMKLLDPPPGPLARPLIEGADIDPAGFRLRSAHRTILRDPSVLSPAERRAGASLRDPEVFRSPKLVSRQTADTLVAALDVSGDVMALNSVHCTRSRRGDLRELTALCAILNSPLARLLWALDGGETREVLPQVHIARLRKLPLPAAFEEHAGRLSAAVPDPRAVHRAVCAAYGLDSGDSGAVLAAYLARYPRFTPGFYPLESGLGSG